MLLTKHHMVGLGIMVFCLRSLRPSIKHIQVSSLARGVGGVLGNKGAVYVRCQILDSSLCIVNAHFAANREQVTKRNNDFWAILTHPAFPDYLSTQVNTLDSLPDSSAVSQLKSELKRIKKRMAFLGETCNSSFYCPEGDTNAPEHTAQLTAEDHDVLIWMGDLNYRIIQSVHISTVYKLIDTNTSLLSEFDQLTVEKDAGAVFLDFHEGLLTFPPTYQFTPGKAEYNKGGKARVPAWCDRILWRTRGVKRSVQPVKQDSAITMVSKDSAADVEDEEAHVLDLADIPVHPYTQDRSVDSDDEESSQATEGAEAEEEVETDLRRNSMYVKRNSLSLADWAAGTMDLDHLLASATSTATNAATGDASTTVTEEAVALPVLPTPMNLHASLNSTSGTWGDSALSPNIPEEELELPTHPAASAVLERVELMAYTSCPGLTLSDHQAVRALLSVKVKRADWAKGEADAIASTLPRLIDPLYESSEEEKQAVLGKTVHTTFHPSVLTLRSLSSEGDTASLFLVNHHPQYRVHYRVCDSHCSHWLTVSPVAGSIAPLGKIMLTVHNGHTASTLRLLQTVEAYAQYDGVNLPTLSKHLALPPNDPSLSVSAVLAIKCVFAKEGSELPEPVDDDDNACHEELLVPVLCSMSIASP